MQPRSSIQAMAGYVPGEQLNDPSIIKLNTNENPYPPSPRVFEAIQSTLTSDKLRKYPEPFGDSFRKAAAKVLNISPESILIGNGSDDLLTIITRAFVPEGGLIVAPTPSYVLYQSLAEIQGGRFKKVPFNSDWQLPKPWPIENAFLTFLPNPNSPSGTALRNAEIERIAAEVRTPFVLDEAYGDFAEENGLALVGKVPNLILTRSFSKFYALAGLRFGFAVADPKVIHELNKVKDSYNCDVLSLAAATAAIEDQKYYADIRAQIIATRGRLSVALADMGFRVTPSQANFVWCQHPQAPHKPIYEALKQQKILIRYMNYADYGDGLRVSIGTNPEIDTLLAELKKLI